jgi:hypothetical protein
MPFIYWVYFDKVGRPERIVARHNEEFMEILKRLIERAGEMPEWIQRGYK